MISLKQGVLISVEGIDGSGKSTLAKNLYQKLNQNQFPVLLTKEPGGTELGKHLRAMLQEKNVPIKPKTEFLLFAADRAQHFDEIIIPALTHKKMVISDRMADSSVVYQGYGRGLSIEMIKTINAWAMHNRTPDITIYIEISLETALQRLKERNQKLTSFESETSTFTKKLIDGFATIFKDRENVIKLDGNEAPDLLTHKAYEEVIQWMKQQHVL
jgi:dTMP kinase